MPHFGGLGGRPIGWRTGRGFVAGESRVVYAA